MIVGWARSTEIAANPAVGQKPADIVRVGKGHRARLVRRVWRRRAQMADDDVMGDEPMAVLGKRPPAGKDQDAHPV